jgi:hypothetical protein
MKETRLFSHLGCIGCLLVLPAVAGCEASTLQSGNDPITSAADSSTPKPIAWQTSTVKVEASEFWIVADGQRFDDPAGVNLHSDPGSGTYTTLELIWNELGREMRLNIYFAADPSGWWSNEVRTYNGQTGLPDWLYYKGTFFKSSIGSPFRGDIDLTNAADDPYRGELHLHGLELSTTLDGS